VPEGQDGISQCRPRWLPRTSLVVLVLLFSPWALSEGADAFSEREIQAITDQAGQFSRLHSLLVVHRGETKVELVQGGPGLDRPANIKSLSKTILASLAGIAIDQGIVEGTDQALVDLLGGRVPESANSGVREITFGHGLSMQAGLESTSGANYGRWVQSEDWVGHVLTRPLVSRPGSRMIYSTGTTHLVSASLHEASGKTTWQLARNWLGEPLGINIPEWMADPQGIHFGGNEMELSPRAIARFGEAWRKGGSMGGRQIIPAGWIEQSWQPRGRSPWTGDDYGYGWFITELGGKTVYYGRGFGGQMLYVVPDSELTIVITSDPNPPSPGGGYFRQLGRMVGNLIIPVSGNRSGD